MDPTWTAPRFFESFRSELVFFVEVGGDHEEAIVV